MGVQMNRPTDGAQAFVEEVEVPMWEGYGFVRSDDSDVDVVEPTADQAGAAPKRRGRPPNNPAPAG